MKHISDWFYVQDMPECTLQYEKLAASLKCKNITDVELWEVAQTYSDPPHLGNIYLYLLLDDIKAALTFSYPELEVEYFINALDTHLYINGEEVFTEDDVWHILQNVQNALGVSVTDA